MGWLLTANIALAVTARLAWWLTHTPPPPPAEPEPDPAAVLLAHLAQAYDRGDNTTGRQLADYLRVKAPGITDDDLAALLLALIGVARHVRKTTGLGIDPLHAMAGLMGRAAVVASGDATDLASLTREDHPA